MSTDRSASREGSLDLRAALGRTLGSCLFALGGYWALDAAAGALAGNGSFLDELVAPGAARLTARILVSVGICALVASVLRVRGRHPIDPDRFQSLFLRSPDPMMMVEASGRVAEANPAAARLFGYDSPDGLTGVDTARLYADPADRERLRLEVVQQGRVEDRDIVIRTRDGRDLWCRESAIPWRDAAGRHLGFQTILRDVSDRKRMEDRLERMAFTDPLTGLPNRRALRDSAERAVALARRTGRSVGLLYLDLIDFKRINDEHGHGEGDRLLGSLARRLLNAARDADTVARMGGDEFAVLLTEIDDAEAAVAASRRILDAVAVPLRAGEHPVRVGARGGLAVFPGDAAGVEDLLRQSDEALRVAKQGGIADVRVWRAGGVEA